MHLAKQGILLYLLQLLACTQNQHQMADLAILNGKLYTINDDMPEAEALAVKNGKIIAIGDNEEIEQYISDQTEVIRLEGEMVMPGFIEAHGHLENLGKFKRQINLFGTKNFAQIISLVEEKVKHAETGEWITGRGWHQEKWESLPAETIAGYPMHEALSEVSPDNPVYLKHASGHALIANAKAMELAGITDHTPDPPDGTIVRDKAGKATGIFEENAADLITEKMNKAIDESGEEIAFNYWFKSVDTAMNECLSKGITTFHDAGVETHKIKWFRQLKTDDKLKTRLSLMLFDDLEKLANSISNYPVIDSVDQMLHIRAIKQYVDGALGTRTALLLEDYEDDPGNRGDMVTTADDLNMLASMASENSMQLCIHAIGDRGVREVLTIFGEHIKEKNNNLRWRIEHAQHVHPDDIEIFKKHAIIASMQPNHCTSDAPYVIKRLGAHRAETESYLWRTFIDNGVRLALGTDTPVEDVNPILNFYSAISRKQSNGDAFYPEQSLTREEALAGYTIGNAYAMQMEEVVGSLEVGKLADIVILSDNILEIPEESIPSTKVRYTILNGKIVFRN